jgi:hypothetical protein
MTRESWGAGAGLWTRSRFQKLKKNIEPKSRALRIEVLESPFSGLLITVSSATIPKMPDQAPASIDSPRPAKGWRYANYRGVGWVALIAIAVETISQLASPSIKSFTAGASVGLLMLPLE